MLRVPEVREELELLEDQQEQLRELEESMRSRMRERFEEMRGQRGEGEDRRRGFEGMREMFEEMRKEAETEVGEILTTQQFDRLKQINAQQQLQRGGGRALMGGPLAEALDLSEEQQEQLRERSQEIQAELRDKMREAQAEAREKLLEILTSEQRAKLDEMMGDPFEMPTPERGFGGRRGPADPMAPADVAEAVAEPVVVADALALRPRPLGMSCEPCLTGLMKPTDPNLARRPVLICRAACGR